MKFFTKKSITQKIIIVAIISILFGFVFPTYSHAGIGGILIDPLVELVGVLFDSLISGLQYFLMDGDFGASGTKGLNTALVNAGDFDGSKYPEFAYDPNSKVTETISKDELTLNQFGAEGYSIPVMKYTPQKIFSNQIPALDANFVNPTQWDTSAEQERSIALQIHDTISSWYVSLRNLTIVGLMSVLLYIGIRIVISSAASEKSKYKQMLVDWLVAMCLVFTLHYIMAFTTTLVNEITAGINGSAKENKGNNIGVVVTAGSSTVTEVGSDGSIGNTTYNGTAYKVDEDGKVWYWKDVLASETIPDIGWKEVTDENLVKEILAKHEEDKQNNTNNNTPTTTDPGEKQFNTDLMGLIRFKMQSSDTWAKLLYLVFYMAMVIYTGMFTFKYLQRVLIIGVLTLISPLVALTYPIDKIKDGKAQAFNKWLKEYVYNILIQPFHLIIYTVFVSSAIELSAKNPIIAIVALAFIMPAEKILRSLFGFDEAKTGGTLSSLAGIAGGTAAFNMINRALTKGGKGEKGGGQGTKESRQIKTKGSAPSLEEAYGSDSIRPIEGENAQGTEAEQPEKPRIGSPSSNAGQDDSASDGWYDVSVPDFGNTATSQPEFRTQEPSQDTVQSVPRQNIKNRPGAAGVGKYLANKGVGTLKSVGRTAGRLASAVPGAMFGLAAGITGDDLGDIVKYTAAGVALSGAAIPRAGRSAVRTVKSEAANLKSAYYGESAYNLQEQTKAYVKSDELDEEFRKKIKNENGGELSSSELRAKKEQGAYFNNIGIEGKDSVKAVALQDKIRSELMAQNSNISSEELEDTSKKRAAVIAKLASSYDDKDLRDDKKVSSLKKSLEKELINSNLSGSEATKQADQIVKQVKGFRGIKDE